MALAGRVARCEHGTSCHMTESMVSTSGFKTSQPPLAPTLAFYAPEYTLGRVPGRYPAGGGQPVDGQECFPGGGTVQLLSGASGSCDSQGAEGYALAPEDP